MDNHYVTRDFDSQLSVYFSSIVDPRYGDREIDEQQSVYLVSVMEEHDFCVTVTSDVKVLDMWYFRATFLRAMDKRTSPHNRSKRTDVICINIFGDNEVLCMCHHDRIILYQLEHVSKVGCLRSIFSGYMKFVTDGKVDLSATFLPFLEAKFGCRFPSFHVEDVVTLAIQDQFMQFYHMGGWSSEVLLATGGGHLVYLDIGDGVLTEVKHAQLEYEVSCLDINPIGENSNSSQLAAVGMWTDMSVRIFYLPGLDLVTKEHLGGEVIPLSVLLCAFEGDTITILRIACLQGIVYSGLAIAKEDELTIGTIDDIQKLHIRTIPLGEQPRRIAHHEQSRTFAICSMKYGQSSTEESEMHFVRLLDDQTFEFISTYPLDTYEYGCSILSCTFADDSNSYYCLGTAYVLQEESEPSKKQFQGRILVFAVEDGKLQLIAEKETKGAVYSLNAFNGKLLAAINQKMQLYKWMLRDDGSRELQSECGHHGHIIALYVQTRGDFIVVGDLMKSINLLIYKEEGAIEERARDHNANWMTAVEILDDDIYLGAENNFNIFTVRKNSEDATDEERGRLEIPTVIYGTVNGVIGVIASLPHEQYLFLEKLQSNLVKVIKGVGGLSHDHWRSFNNEKKTADAKKILDGDLIESFLDLSRKRMEEISKAMSVSVEDLCKRVEELTRLH
ncbi:hypothetical protein IFM89_036807 [Coptis chinensis]|uniref:RSE1/DDB1/CPSF1 C-terminal domain-containing protein n=1 Tax=Coptis chinensis TaxID=261450 RepID=A0A835LLI0_9MAGN|nr:hypothetical protein IFM89_036807 [Coptis chinensis]